MNYEIRKLSPELLEDWLHFFDYVAFAGNDEWAGCYCMCYHWDESLNREKEWGCSKDRASYNRKCAVDLINRGGMQGYLAYHDGEVVGWCNANDKRAYDNVNLCFPSNDAEKNQKVKSIVCFCIAPAFREKGVASQLLENVCADAVMDGYDCIEAYPFLHDAYNAYHGPQALYEKLGFQSCGSFDECRIFRRECV